MFAATIIVLVLLGAVTLQQFWWGWQLIRLFPGKPGKSVADDHLPRVAVLLSLRGADPFLDRCLHGLVHQNYPNYDIRIVIDSREDPAWTLVHETLAEFDSGNVEVSVLEIRRKTCSLKMSALIQAIEGLDDSHDVIVTVDADVIPHANWLRNIVRPLADPQIGATTGVRWYMPREANCGSLVRYLWNAAAILQQQAFGIGWGGSLAFRASLVHDARILEKWSRIMFEDTFTGDAVQSLGMKLRFVPEATMINRESIDLTDCARFISRQLLNVRMYHRSWPKVLGFGIAMTVAAAGTLGCALTSLATGQFAFSLAALTASGAYATSMGLLLYWIESHVRKVARNRGESTAPLSWLLLWAGMVVQFAYPVTLLMAIRAREVKWRGITYRLRGPHRVHLVEYQPYKPHIDRVNAGVSI